MGVSPLVLNLHLYLHLHCWLIFFIQSSLIRLRSSCKSCELVGTQFHETHTQFRSLYQYTQVEDETGAKGSNQGAQEQGDFTNNSIICPSLMQFILQPIYSRNAISNRSINVLMGLSFDMCTVPFCGSKLLKFAKAWRFWPSSLQVCFSRKWSVQMWALS